MLAEHPNAKLVRGLFAAFRARDVAAIRNVLSETAVWHFPGGDGGLAGDHSGHAGIFQFLARVSELTDGTFELDLEEVVANDRVAVALFRGRARRRGRQLDNPTCLKIYLEGGRATEVWEFVWDLYAVDEFWS
jgi:ketosteroid isomerase-like protein